MERRLKKYNALRYLWPKYKTNDTSGPNIVFRSFSCAQTMKYLSTAAIGKYKPQILSLTQDTAHNTAEDKLVSTCQQVGFASIFTIRK